MYGTIQYFDATRDFGILISTDGQKHATFSSAHIAGDPAQIRPGETVIFDEARDGHTIIAQNIRRF